MKLQELLPASTPAEILEANDMVSEKFEVNICEQSKNIELLI
jgi:hypothetical protein